MKKIVLIGGSPSLSSRSSRLLAYAAGLLQEQGYLTRIVTVRQLPIDDLLYGRAESVVIQCAVADVEDADAVVIATPIYKAAYSGILKTFLDLLPQGTLREKVVLPIASGGSPAHLLAIDYALKPVLSALGARFILNGIYAVDKQIAPESEAGIRLDEELDQRLRQGLEHLTLTLSLQPAPLSNAMPSRLARRCSH